ncbi:putative acetate CoA-transferase subunit beta (plasmid) [Clostridium botulinum]|nr:putative acetate CoA-transferase subunit beta [Clostridium botulinum]
MIINDKTKLFTGVTVLEAVYDYQDFIKRNQNLEIISVNILKDIFVLLTYKTSKEDIKG